jgi:hypothetical protein
MILTEQVKQLSEKIQKIKDLDIVVVGTENYLRFIQEILAETKEESD